MGTLAVNWTGERRVEKQKEKNRRETEQPKGLTEKKALTAEPGSRWDRDSTRKAWQKKSGKARGREKVWRW